MSDESQPPQLRLRPRKRDDEPTAPANPAQPTPSPTDAASVPVSPVADGSSRFRLKPKLTQDSEVVAKADVPVEPAAAAPIAEIAPVVPTAIPSEEVHRLKLKAIAPAPAAEPVVISTEEVVLPAITIAPVSAAVVAPLVEPDSTAPDAGLSEESSLVGGLPPLTVKPAAAAPYAPPPQRTHPVAHPAARAQKKSPFGVIVLVVLVAALGGAAYFVFLRRPAPASIVVKPVVAPVTVKPVAAPAPVTVASPAVAPAPASSAPAMIAPLPPPPAPLGTVSTVKTTNPAKSSPAVPVMSAAFRAWIDSARISGVIGGSSPKAIVNGRLVRPGDLIDTAEGIVFDGIDVDQKLLVFRNRSGVFASKSY